MDFNPTLSLHLLLLVLVAVLTCLSIQLGLSWADRAWADEGAERLLGRLASGASIATGLWCAQTWANMATHGGSALAYLEWDRLAFWLLATLAGAAALTGASARQTAAWRWLGASVSLGTALAALHVLSSQATHSLTVLEWSGMQLLSAWMVASAASVLAVAVWRHCRRLNRRAELQARAGAAVLVGLGTLFSQWSVERAAAGASADHGSWWTHPPGLLPAAINLGITIVGLLTLNHLLRARARAQAARITAKREIHTQLLNDPLTGLPTRALFDGTLTQAIQQADAQRERLAMLFINIDDFRSLNQLYGHVDGDRVLRKAAGRIRAIAQPHMAARIANDEFVMLVRDNPTLEDASTAATEVLAALARPFKDETRDLSVTCSIGVVMYPEHGAHSTMIDHAQAAMRAAKAAGGACHTFYDARLSSKGPNAQVGLLRELRTAIDQKQFELFYQAKVHGPTGEITGAEALLRWNHPKRGLVSPTDFIPLAERYGLISALGSWVIDEACRQARVWRDSGLRMRVAINLSMIQLHQPGLAEQVAEALKRHQINPDLITCEITESLAMDDTALTNDVLQRLHAIGVKLSIDDFGTGHSSLAHLRKLRADELKIDRSFVQDLETSEEARTVAAAVVNLAKSLNLKVVAEGVETDGQYRILQGFGCDQLQGFLFAKPMSAKALALWAMEDVGPRTMHFRSSLFKPTMPSAETS